VPPAAGLRRGSKPRHRRSGTSDLVTTAPSDSIAAVGALVRDAGLRHIPVCDDGRRVELVPVPDVLGVLLDAVDRPV
jgi:CBS domain-containing protein